MAPSAAPSSAPSSNKSGSLPAAASLVEAPDAARAATLPPGSTAADVGAPSDATRVGYLTKHGGGQGCFSRKNWKRRYFVLRKNRLSYHGGPGAPELGVIYITPDTGLELSTYKDAKRMVIIITPIRTYHCISDSTDDARDWLTALRTVRSSTSASSLLPDEATQAGSLDRQSSRRSGRARAGSAPDSRAKPKAMGKRLGAAKLQLEVTFERTGDQPLGFRIASTDDDGTLIHIVRDVVADGPAALAGIEKNDILMSANGTQLTGLPHPDATAVLKAASGRLALELARKPKHKKRGVEPLSATATPTAAEPVAASAPATLPVPAPAVPAADDQAADAAPPAAADSAEPVTSPASPTSPTSPLTEEERAERLRRMREARMERKSSKQLELMEVLSIIDNLEED